MHWGRTRAPGHIAVLIPLLAALLTTSSPSTSPTGDVATANDITEPAASTGADPASTAITDHKAFDLSAGDATVAAADDQVTTDFTASAAWRFGRNDVQGKVLSESSAWKSPRRNTKPTPAPTPTPTPSPPVPGRLYASDSFWNMPIGSTPAIDAGSATMVSSGLVAYKDSANFANTDSWGVAIVYAQPTDPLFNIACTKYDCSTSISAHIPAGAKPTTASDHHLVVIDGTLEVDMWLAAYNGTTNTWSAGSRYKTDAYGWGAICSLGQHCNGSVAAGFAAFGGIPRPEEFAGGLIPHALTITTPNTRSGYIACPATHTDGKYASANAIPEGARIQLDPAFNVDAQAWPAWKKTMARTLQVYGAYVSDTGGSLAIRGEADLNREGAWANAGIPEGPSIKDLPWDQMRVLQLTQC